MKYQLVLQWLTEGDSYQLDKLMKIEDRLIERLPRHHEVDGHDIGLGEINIFIITDNPQSAFEEAKSAIGSQGDWDHCRAAFREIDKDQYTILWPKTLSKFAVS